MMTAIKNAVHLAIAQLQIYAQQEGKPTETTATRIKNAKIEGARITCVLRKRRL
jgi:hypothetical protein